MKLETAGSSNFWGDQPYSVKRHGVTITNCDSEPVQTPGCTQSHGALLVLRTTDLVILQASENCERWLGQAPARVLGSAVGLVLGQAQEELIRAALAGDATADNPIYVTTLSADAGRSALDVIVHVSGGQVVVELEAAHANAENAPDYFLQLKKAIARLQVNDSLLGYCQAVSREVRALTGFDRVMVYRFHEDDHGEVFAEDARAGLAPWLGLHYPATDIPQPARDIFLKLWIRPVPEVGAELFELEPLLNPETGQPLDMTYCALRGPSVMYTEYLQNMGVRGGLTMAIRRDGELWGLIACHHYSAPMALPYDLRAACEFLAQVCSLQLRAAEDRDQLIYRLKISGVHQLLVAYAAQRADLAALLDGKPSLLDGIEAGGAAVFYHGNWSVVGHTPSSAQLAELVEWLHARPEFGESGLYATECLSRDYAPAVAFAGVASGVLAVPLSLARRSFLLWFRPEVIRTIAWGGNPHEKPLVLGPHGPRLTPRKSFELFEESVRLCSRPWQRAETDSARELLPLLLDMAVNQAERLADLNAELTRSNEDLDAFAYVASHDLKEPLRGIHKYAHQLLEEASLASEEQRRKLEGMVRLTLRMDSLLDSLLHFSRVGRAPLELTSVDLSQVVSEALEMVDARRSERPTHIVLSRAMPTVRCDRSRMREIFMNLISNAVKYSDQAERQVELGYLAPDEPVDRTAAPPSAAGQTIFFVRDDGIGIAESHRERIFNMFSRLHGRDAYGGGTGAGLAIVKKLVERHGGQIWLVSAVGVGSTFYFTLGKAEP